MATPRHLRPRGLSWKRVRLSSSGTDSAAARRRDTPTLTLSHPKTSSCHASSTSWYRVRFGWSLTREEMYVDSDDCQISRICIASTRRCACAIGVGDCAAPRADIETLSEEQSYLYGRAHSAA